MKRVLLIAGGVLSLGVAIVVVLVLGARNDLAAAHRELDAAQQSLAAAQEDQATDRLDRAETRLKAVQDRMNLLPATLVGKVPLLGSPVRAIDAAAGAGLEVVAAGDVLAGAVASSPLSGDKGLDGSDLSPFHDAAGDVTDDLDRAEDHLRKAAGMLEGPSSASLPMIADLAGSTGDTVDQAIDRLDGARRGLSLLEDLTASGTDARILLLAQDTLELRPTGGFIGSFGVLRFSNGTVDLERYDSFDSLPPPNPPMDPPPYLKEALPAWWGISNVNWWPDFPTTAETAQEMFKRQGGGEVDGVIAITEQLLGDLLGVLGPIQVPGYAEPVVQKGFDQRVLYEVELKRPRDEPRKKFLIELSKIVFDRLFELSGDELVGARDVIDAAVGQGLVQAWFADPSRQELVDGTAWSGALPRTQGDFLMVVDANLTASKANAGVTKDVTYRVDRLQGGGLLGRVDVVVSNGGERDESLNPYYNGYLRIYAPKGARLVGEDEDVGNAGVADDGPFQVFNAYVDVDPGERQRITFRYVLPASVDDGDYRLTWLRQSGTQRDELTAIVNGDAHDVDPLDKSFELGADLTGNPISDRFRDTWIGDRLGL